MLSSKLDESFPVNPFYMDDYYHPFRSDRNAIGGGGELLLI